MVRQSKPLIIGALCYTVQSIFDYIPQLVFIYQRFKMKTKISLLIVALCLAVVLPAQAKTLRLAYDADPVSLDLHEQLSGGTLQLSHMVCDP